MTVSWLLVHSPLVGPLTWAPVARVLDARGFEVAVAHPTSLAEATAPAARVVTDAAETAAERLSAPISVVGHSGAGAFLPAIGERLDARCEALLFVDAVVPPPRGAHVTPAGMRALLDEQTEDGLLRRWLEWWPVDTVEQLLPDPRDRRALQQDMPRLPRTFFDQPVEVPGGWSDHRCAYLKLSEAYADEFADAGERGWTRMALDGNHLSIFTEPVRVVEALLALSHRRAGADRRDGYGAGGG